MRNFFIILMMKVFNFGLKLAKRQGGNALGKYADKLNPQILTYFKIDCPVISVTGTNGKTTTNNAMIHTLEKAGYSVVHNGAGNNMDTGILSTLIKHCSLTGKIKADFICFEVDESYIPTIFKQIRLDTLVVLNFFRDQLDRTGEVESLILKINEFLKTYDGNLILNNDDPNVARLGLANPNNDNIYYYCAEQYKHATKTMTEAGEGKFCPFCKTRLDYEYYQYSHIGKFNCPNCSFGNNSIYKEASNIDLDNKNFSIDGINYQITENNIYTIYNYIAAISALSLYNIEPSTMQESFSTFKLNKGRAEKLEIKGATTIINLAKNPTGVNVSLRTLQEDEEDKELFFVLNDNLADGFDVSWIWDINFENLDHVTRIITSGLRAYDIAIRIKTSGFDESKIFIFPDLAEAVSSLYQNTTKKYVIANYTALEPTRRQLLQQIEGKN